MIIETLVGIVCGAGGGMLFVRTGNFWWVVAGPLLAVVLVTL